MRVLSVIGARPQFIKHASMQKRLQEHQVDEVLLHTGQHFDANMSEMFFHTLSLKSPDIHLKLSSRDALSQLAEMIAQMQAQLRGEHFDWVLVYGDTTSTLAGSLFAKENHLALGHIEAGVRSYDMRMPEERNRLICDQLSDKLFAPTLEAMDNLKGVRGEVVFCGDIMEESYALFSPFATRPDGLHLQKDFILCTLHRQSNVDDPNRLAFLLEGFSKITLPIVLPLHPRTKMRIQEFGLTIPSNLYLLPPQGYLQILWLLKHCKSVFTDSGGLQKEAVYASKPALILREVSEWGELIESGACILLGEMEVQEAYACMPKTLPSFSFTHSPSQTIIKELLKR